MNIMPKTNPGLSGMISQVAGKNHASDVPLLTSSYS